MYRQPLGKVGYGGLRPGVCGYLGEGGVGVHGGYIQYIAALPAYHVLCEGLGGYECAQEVKIEHELNSLLLQVKERLGFRVYVPKLEVFFICGGPGIVSACAVYEDITLAQVLQYRLTTFLHGVLIQHITFVGYCLAVLCGYLSGDLFCRFEV